MHCPSCNQEIPDSARACGYCGHKLSPAPLAAPPTGEAARRCPNCGQTISATAKACGYCGHKLTPAPPAAPSTAEAARRCPNCGQTVPANAKVCGHCGHELAQPGAACPLGAIAIGVVLVLLVAGLLRLVGPEGSYEWWYAGLRGLGGWALGLLLAVIATAYVFFDSQSRGVPATGWKMATLVPVLLILPTLFYRFAASETQQSLLNLKGPFFYLGIVGGVLPVAAAIGYLINFAGVKAERPEAAAEVPSPPPPSPPRPAPPPPPAPPRAEPARARPRVNAWLVNQESGESYQLLAGDTRLGRGRANDIILADTAVSREQALIREEGGRFTLYDRASKSGTFVGGHRVESPVLLEHGDIIEMGDTQLKFVTSL